MPQMAQDVLMGRFIASPCVAVKSQPSQKTQGFRNACPNETFH
jgi:hypothetical protein